nr:MAG TPA: hypothetical protein [Caudoviricetes sp.]
MIAALRLYIFRGRVSSFFSFLCTIWHYDDIASF